MSSDAQSQAQSARTAEDRRIIRPDHPRSEESVRRTSSTEKDIGFGVDRTDSERSDFLSPSIVGKIITQLIKEAEDQLGNARACIKWYEDEEQKALAKLEELRQLEESIEIESDEISEE